jgi:hypothetical protein
MKEALYSFFTPDREKKKERREKREVSMALHGPPW